MRYTVKLLSILCLLSLGTGPVIAGEPSGKEKKNKPKVSLRDSLDHAFDVSDWVITKKGFIPMPIIITEPSLGGFGIGMTAIFIDPNDPKVVDGKYYPRMPNIYAGGGLYTLNKSWGAGGGGIMLIPKWNAHVKLFTGYMDMNMDYYYDSGTLGETQFEFNIRTYPVFFSFEKDLHNPRFTIGTDYIFAMTKVKLTNNDGVLPDAITGKELDSKTAQLGLRFQYDSRDNTFTPNKGLRSYIRGRWSNPVVGSDYKFGLFMGSAFWFIPIVPSLTNGVHLEVQQVAGKMPFYLKPYIDMRGVPAERYQGKSTLLLEVEERWDFTRRWSAMLFGGGGKAFDEYSDFGKASWAWGYGTGFRYLIARKLNLRMGADIAMGPQGFTYYLIFGSAWTRE